MKIELGCSCNKTSGYLGVDMEKLPGVDVVHDLETFPYPFDDNSADEILASHILEHLRNWREAIAEANRILKPKGLLIIKVPHFSCANAYSNPEHVNRFASDTFRFMKGFKHIRTELHYMDTRYCDKKSWKRIPDKVISWLANLNVWLCERIWMYWVGGFGEVYVELLKKETEK